MVRWLCLLFAVGFVAWVLASTKSRAERPVEVLWDRSFKSWYNPGEPNTSHWVFRWAAAGFARDLASTPDGGAIIVGEVEGVDDPDQRTTWIVRFDSHGRELWRLPPRGGMVDSPQLKPSPANQWFRAICEIDASSPEVIRIYHHCWFRRGIFDQAAAFPMSRVSPDGEYVDTRSLHWNPGRFSQRSRWTTAIRRGGGIVVSHQQTSWGKRAYDDTYGGRLRFVTADMPPLSIAAGILCGVVIWPLTSEVSHPSPCQTVAYCFTARCAATNRATSGGDGEPVRLRC